MELPLRDARLTCINDGNPRSNYNLDLRSAAFDLLVAIVTAFFADPVHARPGRFGRLKLDLVFTTIPGIAMIWNEEGEVQLPGPCNVLVVGGIHAIAFTERGMFPENGMVSREVARRFSTRMASPGLSVILEELENIYGKSAARKFAAKVGMRIK